MPYCKKANFLFVHIPKTGGGSVKNYLSNKFSDITLYTGFRNNLIPNNEFKKYSLQHQFYTKLFEYRDVLQIDFNELLKVAASVRNPYTRIISDLFHFKLIENDTTQDEVYNIILNNYLNRTNLDNHNVPQYKFVVDDKDEIIEKIHIFKCETLIDDMQNFGFNDFKLHTGSSRNKELKTKHEDSYLKYLNNDSIRLINEFYKKDFELFNYDMINITN